MKFQVKPSVPAQIAFEAHQFHSAQPVSEWPEWLQVALNKTQGTLGAFYEHATRYWVNELSKDQAVNDGDWILKEDGSEELAVVAASLFETMYEPTEASFEARLAKLEQAVFGDDD
jgi:hypothetical protein